MATIIDIIISVYGRESPFTVTCEKVHGNLGTTIDFYEKGKVKLNIYDYILYMLEEFPEYTKTGEAETPDGDHLFTTNK